MVGCRCLYTIMPVKRWVQVAVRLVARPDRRDQRARFGRRRQLQLGGYLLLELLVSATCACPVTGQKISTAVTDRASPSPMCWRKGDEPKLPPVVTVR